MVVVVVTGVVIGVGIIDVDVAPTMSSEVPRMTTMVHTAHALVINKM